MACRHGGPEWKTVDGIFIVEMRFPCPGARVNQHVHEYGHNTLLVSGSVRMTTNGITSQVFKAPSLIFIPAGEEHEFEALENNTLAYCLHYLDGKDAPSILRPHHGD